MLCAACGRENLHAGAFCTGCGARLTPSAAAAPTPRTPAAAQAQAAEPPLASRLVGSWLPMVYVVIIGYFDYISHREWVPLFLMGGVALGAIVFRKAIFAQMRPLAQYIPERWFPIVLAAVPSLIYFLARGSGTLSSSGVLMIVVAMGALVFGVATRGEAIDRALEPWYRWRDGILPRQLRLLVPPFVAVFLSFAVAQGTLSDFDALFGGTTGKSAVPNTSKILLATLLTVVVTFLLAREPAKEQPG